MSFENKVVFITGAGSGIGEATAILFAKEGADVVIVDRNEQTANKTAEKCKQFGKRVLVIKADVSKDDQAKTAIEKTINYFRNLDVLVNNAGFARTGNLLSGTIMDTYDEVMGTNLRAVILMTSLATPYLIKTKGCVVNTSSIASKAMHNGRLFPAYAIAKTGVDSFTRLAALELASSGVRVNAINPGPVFTNVIKNSGLDFEMAEMAKSTALHRVSDPQEIADLIVYLSSDKAKSITGVSYFIDNGMSLL